MCQHCLGSVCQPSYRDRKASRFARPGAEPKVRAPEVSPKGLLLSLIPHTEKGADLGRGLLVLGGAWRGCPGFLVPVFPVSRAPSSHWWWSGVGEEGMRQGRNVRGREEETRRAELSCNLRGNVCSQMSLCKSVWQEQ